MGQLPWAGLFVSIVIPLSAVLAHPTRAQVNARVDGGQVMFWRCTLTLLVSDHSTPHVVLARTLIVSALGPRLCNRLAELMMACIPKFSPMIILHGGRQRNSLTGAARAGCRRFAVSGAICQRATGEIGKLFVTPNCPSEALRAARVKPRPYSSRMSDLSYALPPELFPRNPLRLCRSASRLD